MSTPAPGSTWPRSIGEEQTWLPNTAWTPGTGLDDYGDEIPVGGSRARSRSSMPDPSLAAASSADVASRELSRLDAELGGRVASFAPVLLRSEAASSSQIENITASARAIFSAELGAKTSRNAELIAANTRAMTAAIELADVVTPDAIARMHEVLMAGQSRHTPGRWRDEAVWIGTRSDSPVGAEFVAPHHLRIEGLLDDVTAFARRSDVAPLVSVAVAHAQFETIHPFSDGNGRTGRALAQALLRYRGVTRNVAVPVSAGLLADVEGYHRAAHGVSRRRCLPDRHGFLGCRAARCGQHPDTRS